MHILPYISTLNEQSDAIDSKAVCCDSLNSLFPSLANLESLIISFSVFEIVSNCSPPL
jgi:hypothetical protein